MRNSLLQGMSDTTHASVPFALFADGALVEGDEDKGAAANTVHAGFAPRLFFGRLLRLMPQRRSTWVVLVLYSALAAFTTLVGLRVVRTKWYYSGNYEENYFAGFQALDPLLFIVLLAGFLCATVLILALVRALLNRISLRTHAFNPTLVFCVSWVVIFVCWAPYFLVNYPSALYADSIVIIKQALGINALSSHHPIAYVGLIGVFLHIGKTLFDSYIVGISLYTAFQMVFMSAVFAYLLAWMAKKRIPLPAIIVVGTFISFFSIFPIHAVSMWKDGLYAVCMLRLSLLLFDVVASQGGLLRRFDVLARVVLWSFLPCLLRSNGIYVIAGVWLVVLVLYKKRALWQVFAAGFVTLYAFWLVVGPLSAFLEVRTEPVESYGIPLQQVAAVVVFDGNMTSEQEEFLDTLLPLEEYKDEYIPCSVDGIKWADNFDSDFFNEHQGEFMQLWAALGLANPGIYARAYTLESYEYWSMANVERNVTYNGVNDKYDAPDLGIIETNLLEAWFGDAVKGWFPFRFLHPQEGLASWLVLFAGLMLYVARREGWCPPWYTEYNGFSAEGVLLAPFAKPWWLFLLPAFGNWLTVLISSPFAALPRYILPAIFILPLIALLPWLVCASESMARKHDVFPTAYAQNHTLLSA